MPTQPSLQEPISLDPQGIAGVSPSKHLIIPDHHYLDPIPFAQMTAESNSIIIYHTFSPISTPFLTAVLKGQTLIPPKSQTPLLLYTSSATNLLTSSSDSAVTNMTLPVISGASPSSGCLDKVAPPKRILPEATAGLVEARWAGRTERRVERELGWSGRWTRYSFADFEEEEDVDVNDWADGGIFELEVDILCWDDAIGG
jgi:hypothetical protein